MIDAWSSEPKNSRISATRPLRGQVILVAVAAILIIGGAGLWRIAVHETPVAQPVKVVQKAPARDPALDDLLKTTRALNDSQQQAIDQLQVLQDTVASQAAALKASSDQVAALNDKLESLRQSFASAAQQPPLEQAEKSPTDKPHESRRRLPSNKSHRGSKRHGPRAHS
jgi:septal ring factor EnvC (AmiA/AmiB activator)